MLFAYIRARLAREEGQALVEYALIIALIAVVCVGALTLAGNEADRLISAIGNSLKSVTP